MKESIKHIEQENQKTTAKKKTISQISDSVLIKVKSGFHGKLYYKNTITGETTIWDNSGDIQVMSMRNLRDMKARQVAFFKNQWVIILGVADGEECEATPDEIYRSLIVAQYYQNFIDPSNFAVVCGWSDSEINERIPLMSPTVKENLIVALNGYIKEGRLDSIRKIKVFEKILDCKLSTAE